MKLCNVPLSSTPTCSLAEQAPIDMGYFLPGDIPPWEPVPSQDASVGPMCRGGPVKLCNVPLASTLAVSVAETMYDAWAYAHAVDFSLGAGQITSLAHRIYQNGRPHETE